MRRFYAPIVIVVLTLTLSILNYQPGTTLIGWDNLHSEFNISINLKRSFFSVWQEYQSLGLLGGMGHAADLIRQLFIALLLYIIPQEIIRYTITNLTLALGGIGAYYLARKFTTKNHTIYPLIAGIFYIFNISTLQTYYVPFETFTAHFAALPFLLLTLINYLKNSNPKNTLLLALTLLLATPSAYVPTLYVVFLIAAAIIAPFAIKWKKNKKPILKKFTALAIVIFAINAFWALPFAYFTLTSSDVNINSKINQMATENIYLQNKEYGNLWNAIQLKGFWFSNIDLQDSRSFDYMLAPWKEHFDNPLVIIAALIIFLTVLLGVITSWSKSSLHKGFILLFFLSLTMLVTDTPPFEQINTLFRQIPLFNQAFRFPFTKFSILTSLTFAVFLGIGLQTFTKKIRFKPFKVIPTTIITALIVVTMLPATNNFYYYKQQRQLPQEYTQLFQYFKNQDQNTRIANLPQHTFWGWNFYDWGYGGSGFLWYGIKQPILDRAFDVWSQNSEQYYYELSHAIYSQNPSYLKNVLDKYQINWIIIDKNIIYPLAPKSLAFDETKDLLSTIPSVSKEVEFKNIEVYKVDPENKSKDYIRIVKDVPNINDFKWAHRDTALSFTDSYYTDSTLEYDYFLPFRSLHSGKFPEDKEFKIDVTENQIALVTQIPPSKKRRQLFIPNYASQEKMIPTRIYKTVNENSQTVFAVPLHPTILIGDIQTLPSTQEIELFSVSTTDPISLDINGLTQTTLSSESDNIVTPLSLTQTNIITASVKGESQSIELSTSQLSSSFSTQHISLEPTTKPVLLKINFSSVNDKHFTLKTDPKSLQTRNCDRYRDGDFTPALAQNGLTLTAENATACTSIFSRTLSHSTGYAITIKATNTKGRGLHFWLLNATNHTAPLDTYLPSDKKTSTTTFIVPPQESFGTGYSLHFDNISIGNNTTENTLISANMTPIPYNFIKGLTVVSEDALPSSKTDFKGNTSHPNESLYTVSTSLNPNEMIALAQSYDPAWTAYEVNSQGTKEKYLPFIFGKKVKDHKKLNGWENAFIPDCRNCKLVIVYLPQYLQYFGFILLISTFIYAVLNIIRSKSHPLKKIK